MVLKRQGRSTHLVSKNKKIKIWYRQLGYVSNTKVIKASTLVNGINLQQIKYNPSKVLFNLKELKQDIDKENTDTALTLAL